MWKFLLLTIFLLERSEGRHISVIRASNPKTFALKDNPTQFFNPLDDHKTEKIKDDLADSSNFHPFTFLENSTKVSVTEKTATSEASTLTYLTIKSITDDNLGLPTDAVSVGGATDDTIETTDFDDEIEVVTSISVKTTDFYDDLDHVTNLEEETTDFYDELESGSGDFSSSSNTVDVTAATDAKSTDFYDEKEVVICEIVELSDFYDDLDHVTNLEEETTDFYIELESGSGDFFSPSSNTVGVTAATDAKSTDFYDEIEVVTSINVKTTDFYEDFEDVTKTEEKTIDFYDDLESTSSNFSSSTNTVGVTRVTDAKTTDFHDEIVSSGNDYVDDESLVTTKLLPTSGGSGSGSGDGDDEDGSGSGSGDHSSDFDSDSGSGSGDFDDYLVRKQQKDSSSKEQEDKEISVENDFVFIDDGDSPPLGRKDGPYWEMIPRKRDPFLSDKIHTLEEIIPEKYKEVEVETATLSVLTTTDFSDKSLFGNIISPEVIESELGISNNDYLVIIDGYEFKSEDPDNEKEFSPLNY